MGNLDMTEPRKDPQEIDERRITCGRQSTAILRAIAGAMPPPFRLL
jgi:hypothetical protein